jgi:hypothetical protein
MLMAWAIGTFIYICTIKTIARIARFAIADIRAVCIDTIGIWMACILVYALITIYATCSIALISKNARANK